MDKLIGFYSSPLGRKLVNWGVTSLGALITSGVIPLDAPIPGLGVSVGWLVTLIGLRLPSHSVHGPV
jgi:hypothetical protein